MKSSNKNENENNKVINVKLHDAISSSEIDENEAKYESATEENKRLKEKLHELQTRMDRLSLQSQTKDDQMNEAEINIKTMELNISNLRNDIEAIKRKKRSE